MQNKITPDDFPLFQDEPYGVSDFQKAAKRFQDEQEADDFQELSEEELDERLIELGYDPIELVQRMRARIEKAIDESPLNPKNQQADSE